jgi:hypothetical protein
MKVNPQTPPVVWFNDRNNEKSLILKPPYQRKPVWSPDQKAYLIDTILKGYLIPEIFIHRVTDHTGKTIYNVVDGQQRIRSVLEYISGEYPLSSEYTPEYADYNFEDLPNPVKQSIWDYTINVREITNASEEEVRNLFRRMNKNVVPLNPQELRHSTYSGDFIKLMEEIAEYEYWAENKIVTAKEIRRMNDVQFISDLFISMMNGIQDKTKEMDNYYEFYETNFQDKNKWLKRFLDIMGMITKIFIDIRTTRWKNKSDYYTLFLALNELTQDKKDLKVRYDKIENDLINFSEKISEATLKENKDKKYPKDIFDYMNAVIKSTTDKDRRITRNNIVVKIIKNHIK